MTTSQRPWPTFSPAMGYERSGANVTLGRYNAERRANALSSFQTFLPYWYFINRETGHAVRFSPESLWQAQRELAEVYDTKSWVFALKAGKLGFTQLETAFDAYRALTIPNARIHLFSMNQEASISLLDYVRYGLRRLPSWFEVRVRDDLAGGDKTQSLKLQVGPDEGDVRTLYSYAGGDNVSIDQTCIHAHVDELARMSHPEATWASIQSTVSPDGGTCHIVTRGQGENDWIEETWDQSVQGQGKLTAYFAPWTGRPDRDRRWYETESSTMTPQQMAWFAPEDPEDAFLGDATQTYIPMEWWDRCTDTWLVEHPLLPGDRTPLILGMDAGVTNDNFAIVAVCRHPQYQDRVAVRAVKIWKPAQFGGRIDFDYIERWIRVLCRGGCAGSIGEYGLLQQHPAGSPNPTCDACQNARMMEPFNVLEIAYDSHELEQMAQRLARDRVTWMFDFNQGELRLEADKGLFDLVVWGRLAHNGDVNLREHINNAKAKIPKDEDKKLRIIKKSPARKVDAAVALSMAAHQCMYLNVPKAPPAPAA